MHVSHIIIINDVMIHIFHFKNCIRECMTITLIIIWFVIQLILKYMLCKYKHYAFFLFFTQTIWDFIYLQFETDNNFPVG